MNVIWKRKEKKKDLNQDGFFCEEGEAEEYEECTIRWSVLDEEQNEKNPVLQTTTQRVLDAAEDIFVDILFLIGSMLDMIVFYGVQAIGYCVFGFIDGIKMLKEMMEEYNGMGNGR